MYDLPVLTFLKLNYGCIDSSNTRTMVLNNRQTIIWSYDYTF